MKNTKVLIITILSAAALSAQLSVAQTSGSSGKSSANPTASGLRASKLIGADVKSASGQDYGKLEDIVLDQTGKATFAIIGKGGILHLGEKRLPVPWQALSLNSEKQVTLNADPQKLQSAPTVSSGTATELDNPDFVVVVYKFYEIPSGAGETPGGSQSGSSKSSSPSSSQTNSSTPNP